MNYDNKVNVNGTMLNVYTEGKGAVTVVFMAGNGVTCPVLEYKPVYRRLSEKYRIAVIEKAGYGLSGGTNEPRKLENLVENDREALKKAGIAPPYVLAAHSYSGFEAIYWANTYPDEVKAVLSMDMGIPETAIQQSYEITELKRLKLLDRQFKVLKLIARDGVLAKITRSKTENVSGLMTGTELNSEEKELYQQLFYRNIANTEYYEEARLMTENAKKAEATGVLKCPCCFFISDMKTLSKNVDWRKIGTEYAQKCGGEVHLSDKGHFMYAYIPDEMAETFDNFIKRKVINAK
ncbi:MAG: alpha/beta hydrolase [Ruminococcus sp.]|nr:alpha/beta hydrolase [Ruminococcus sp.]